jgi:hypothetical protein
MEAKQAATRYTRYSHTGLATRIDRIYGPRYHSPWRWTYIDSSHSTFTSKGSPSDHLPVVATVETARARKSTIHELKIDNSLYSDQQVRRHVTLLWEATYQAFPPSSHGHAVSYSNAKEAVAALLRDLTRKKKQKLFPTT